VTPVADDDDATAVAAAASATMRAGDRAAELLRYEVTTIGPGHAVVEMTIGPEMLNGLDVCHGGLIFTLADSAMAHASNSHGRPAFAVAASIDFIAPGRAGAHLTATARERSRQGRTALYDVEVTDEAGALVARFHGRTQHPGR
jgi:acyl-CoA thioesterase